MYISTWSHSAPSRSRFRALWMLAWPCKNQPSAAIIGWLQRVNSWIGSFSLTKFFWGPSCPAESQWLEQWNHWIPPTSATELLSGSPSLGRSTCPETSLPNGPGEASRWGWLSGNDQRVLKNHWQSPCSSSVKQCIIGASTLFSSENGQEWTMFIDFPWLSWITSR